MLARLANYLEGHAAISPALARAVAEMPDQPGLPRIPAAGNGGAGEIQALSHLLGGLAERFTLGPKDSLSLINGSPCAAALVADAALAAARRLAVAEEVFALSAEALPMPLAHIAPELEGLWSDPAETETLIRLRQLLAGGAETRRPYQAPVSFRILPRLLARLRRAVVGAEAAAETSLPAVTDNPVFIPPDAAHPNGHVLSNGGFQNTMAWPAMDEIAAAYADLATLAERHQTRLLSDAETGLPDYPSGATAEQPFLGCLPMAAVGFAEAARHAAQRTFLPASEGGGFVQNDVASPNFFAWERQEEAARMLEATLAGLALVVARAFDDAGREAPPALAELLAECRRLGQPQAGPSALGQASERIAEALRTRIYAGDEVGR